MPDLFLFKLLSLCILTLCIYTLYHQVGRVLEKLAETKSKLNRISTWASAIGIIKRLGINTDYVYIEKLPNIPDNLSDKEYDLFHKTFMRRYENSLRNQKYLGAEIRYEYIINGQTFTSRNIKILPTINDKELVYKYKLGADIEVFYDIDNPGECVLQRNTSKDYDIYMWNTLYSLRYQMFACVASIVLVIVII